MNIRSQGMKIPNPNYIEYPPQPKGHCIVCGKKLTGRQRKYCSSGYYNTCGGKWYYHGRKEIFVYWAEFRGRILLRDNKTCQDCGIKKIKGGEWIDFEVHHIVPISKGGEFFDADNCITLCHDCHWNRHRELNKKEKLGEGQSDILSF